MVETVKSTYDFIKGALPVRVGVLASDDAEAICLKNNLTFADLVKPFSTLTNESQISGPSSQSYRVYNLHVHALDVKKPATEYDTAASSKEAMASQISDYAGNDNIPTVTIDSGDYSLSVNRTCPWMEIYRQFVFRSGPPQNHEYVGHLVACMLVISSSHPSPMQQFSDISQQQNRIQHGDSGMNAFKWMTPNTMKYYVLLHDVNQGDISKAKEVFSSLQSMFGQNAVYLLQINSRAVSTTADTDIPVPWRQFKSLTKNRSPQGPEAKNSDVTLGCCLTMEDHNSLRSFMQDFIVRALLPHLEKTIRNINEQLSTRKGLHKSFFRATRTIFGSSKNSSSASGTGYHNDSNELLVRKAADLCFLSQMYDQALHLYHGAKKDYMNDQAWLHAAGASEMAALSNFMMRNPKQSYPAHYMEYAINTYVDVCKKDYLALRCSLVHVECLQLLGLYQEAAFHLVRMTDEKDDLRSALLLEQAAHCYLKMPNPQPKKFAFQLVLAGLRFSKCGQKLHAIRCYEMASQMYIDKGWQLIDDHLDYAVGRLYSSIKDYDHAKNYFRKLLIKKSSLTEVQQIFVLREFGNAWHKCEPTTNSRKSGNLCLPELILEETSASVGDTLENHVHPDSEKSLNAVIRDIEETYMDKKLITRSNLVGAVTYLCRSTNNTQGHRISVGESALVEVTCTNHLCIPIVLFDIKLQFDSMKDDSTEDSHGLYHCESIDQMNIAANSKSTLKFTVKPSKPGKFIAKAITYSIGCHLAGEQSDVSGEALQVLDSQQLNIKGKRLNGTREEKYGIFYGGDNRLTLDIFSDLPEIKGSFESLPVSMICNEIVQATLTVRNTGKFSISQLEFAAIGSIRMSPEGSEKKEQLKKEIFFHPLLQTPLAPGDVGNYHVTLRAPATTGHYSANVMLFCKSDELPSPSFRSYLLRHEITCFDGVNVTMEMINPLAEKNCVISASVEAMAGQDAEQFSFREISLLGTETPVKPIGSASPTTVPLRTKLYKYFMLGKNEITDFNAMLSAGNKPAARIKWSYGNAPQDSKVNGQQVLDVKHASQSDVGNSETSDSLESAEALKYLHHTVSWRLSYKRSYCHDFSTTRLCIIDCELIAFNTSNYKLNVNVNTTKPTTTGTHHSTGFSWIGVGKVKRTVEPHGKTSVILKACFSKPGIFSLGGVIVSAIPVESGAGVPIPQKPLSSYYVNITDMKSECD